MRPVLAGEHATGVHFTGGGQVSQGGCVVAEAARGLGAGAHRECEETRGQRPGRVPVAWALEKDASQDAFLF